MCKLLFYVLVRGAQKHSTNLPKTSVMSFARTKCCATLGLPKKAQKPIVHVE